MIFGDAITIKANFIENEKYEYLIAGFDFDGKFIIFDKVNTMNRQLKDNYEEVFIHNFGQIIRKFVAI